MPDKRSDPQDLETLKPAQSDWDDGMGEEATPQDDEGDETEELLEDVLHVEAEDPEDVIMEDDDNPYEESDEALPDDEEERAITRELRE